VIVSFVGAVGVSLLTNLATEVPRDLPPWIGSAFGVSAVVLAVVSVLIGDRAGRSTRETAKQSNEAFHDAAERAVAALEATSPAPEPTLEDEIADVSVSLSQTVTRLRQISDKAEAFEAEVKALVDRAEAAKATASLHEDDARKIALLLGLETEERFRTEIAKLTEEHGRQIEKLRKSGNRMAMWTFVGGVALGIIGNIVVALMVR
jgi:gas vesicle protein